MDQADIVITDLKVMNLPKLEIVTNESKRYVCDLSGLQRVYCFPKNQEEWVNVGITASGFNLTWGTRFEVSVEQAIDASESVSEVKRRA